MNFFNLVIPKLNAILAKTRCLLSPNPLHHGVFLSNSEQTISQYDSFLKRKSILQQINNNSIIIRVPGDSSRRVGQTVNINIPLPEPIKNGVMDVYDKHVYALNLFRYGIGDYNSNYHKTPYNTSSYDPQYNLNPIQIVLI